MSCDEPKTKLQIAFKAFKIFLKYLDNNKAEAIIFFIGGAIAMSVAFLDVEKIKLIVGLFQ